MHRAVVLISGTGRNLQAIIDAIAARRLALDLRLVLADRPAAGLARAEAAGVATSLLRPGGRDRAAYGRQLADVLDAEVPDLVVLAGFLRILDSAFVQHYSGRIVNIHPSLLPRHRGLDTHRRALAAGDARHGATVHFVTTELDAGPALIQGSLAVASNDTPQRLADRVMERVETRIYPQALSWLAEGRADWHQGRARLDGQTLKEPEHVDCDSS
ncbi:MAG: phosphoribosylglycinamide formyltransferase [Salinisphaera sp.]|nr:phosphoribosylglycinamide formyltransferase [Salinisphaera sp.]